ncbi:MAG: hypothetical protein QOI51_2087, partial [Nocardioidaceae bacterium]|nr:hypothetical protein [Nocardioidaceae bacterium]
MAPHRFAFAALAFTVTVSMAVAAWTPILASTLPSASVASTGPVWATVTAGEYFSCGIRTDQTLWCWGYNGNGELGLGDTTARNLP